MAGLKGTYERLRERDQESPLAPPELVELATAAYLLGKDDDSLTTLIRAYQGFVQQRNLRRGGGIAARISSILMNGSNAAQAAGWLARATRLLDESGDPGVERGYLLVAEARHAIMSGHVEQAADTFAEAAAIGERFADADLTSLARQGHGRVLIERGETERGIALLDEAMVAATAGELSTIIAGIVYCSVLSACADLFDVGRAREWTEALTRWCDAQPDLVPYRGECLVHRAEVISLRGVWPDALHEALLACERLGEPPVQPAFGAALYQVAELHRLRGELDEAEGGYRRAAESGKSPHPGLALLRLAQGRREDAAASIGRVLQEARHRRVRTRVLSAAVEIMLACGDLVAARNAASELGTHARTLGTPFVRAAAAHAQGAVALAEGDAKAALALCRTALTVWCELEVPYEAARARVLIAQACRALGDKDSADLELKAACRTFEQLGARLDLASLRPSVETARRPAGLTARELQVLRLVATGRTNRSIGDALQLSEKTVARHLANLFVKLDVFEPRGRHCVRIRARTQLPFYIELTTCCARTRCAIQSMRRCRSQATLRGEVSMAQGNSRERFHTIVIGGGQAGLSVGYYLARQGRPFVILDASPRVGDAWRSRWDSLRLFTPAMFDGLVGMTFPGPPFSFPTKDQMADYLELYARHFQLPVRSGVRVDRLTRAGSMYLIDAGPHRLEADHVVVAMSSYQVRRIPTFAEALDPGILQIHSIDYRGPAQLKPGGVLLVGAGNSGAEIAMETAREHPTWLSGRDTGHVPFRIDGAAARLFLVRFLFRIVFHRVLTVRTPMGRSMRRKMFTQGAPLIRVKPKDLAAAGVQRVGRIVGVVDGRPALEDSRRLDITNVIWCTGFGNGLSWIDLPIFEPGGEPRHESGIATGEPGLYFVGLHFLHSFSSTMIHGVARDAQRIALEIERRTKSVAPSTALVTPESHSSAAELHDAARVTAIR